MTLLLLGLRATQLMASDGSSSVVVVQTGGAAVKSWVSQMPPLTAAAKTCLVSSGSTARALTAPPSRLVAGVGPMTLSFVPTTSGLGPGLVHRGCRGTKETPAGRVRSSRT